MSLPAADHFDRANEDPLAGNWTAPDGSVDSTFILTSDHIEGRFGPNFQLMYWNADGFANNQKSQVTISGGSNLTDAGTYAAVGVRIQASGQSGYLFGIFAGDYKLRRLDSGIDVFLAATLPDVPTAGDVLRIEVNGTDVLGYLNNVLRSSATDATYSAGQAGMFGYGGSQFQLDDWTGDNIGVSRFLLVRP